MTQSVSIGCGTKQALKRDRIYISAEAAGLQQGGYSPDHAHCLLVNHTKDQRRATSFNYSVSTGYGTGSIETGWVLDPDRTHIGGQGLAIL